MKAQRPTPPHRITLRLTDESQTALAALCSECRRGPTTMINTVISRLHAEIEIMKGALDIFVDSAAPRTQRSLPKGDIIIARLLSRLIESNRWIPDDLQLRNDL